jgi:hypothetical protein
MAHGNLPAVGVARFEPRAGLAVDDDDFMAGLAQEPRGCGADDAGAKYYDFH